MRIHFSGPMRAVPKVGDTRTTRKHGLQVRVHQRHNGMVVVSRSRYCYEWVAVTAENIEKHRLQRFNLLPDQPGAAP